jgi:hypothetical protein
MTDSIAYMQGSKFATSAIPDKQAAGGVANILKVQVVGPDGGGENATAKTDRSLTATTTSQRACPANPARYRLLIQNLDAAVDVHVNLGSAATTGAGSLKVSPESYLDLTGTTQTVNVVASQGTADVTIWEF